MAIDLDMKDRGRKNILDQQMHLSEISVLPEVLNPLEIRYLDRVNLYDKVHNQPGVGHGHVKKNSAKSGHQAA